MNLKNKIAREVENAKYAGHHSIPTAERIMKLFYEDRKIKKEKHEPKITNKGRCNFPYLTYGIIIYIITLYIFTHH